MNDDCRSVFIKDAQEMFQIKSSLCSGFVRLFIIRIRHFYFLAVNASWANVHILNPTKMLENGMQFANPICFVNFVRGINLDTLSLQI